MPELDKKILILLSGGGTMGSVSPLMAIFEQYKKNDEGYDFMFVGTSSGPEGQVIKKLNIPFYNLQEAKWRRYFSWSNILSPIIFLIAFVKSIRLLYKKKPKVIVSAGSYVSVPLAWAGKIIGIPIIIYQMDVVKGLANKLMTPLAKKIVVAFRHHLYQFPREKTDHIGLIVRPSLTRPNLNNANKIFGIDEGKKTILIVGGGTGALNLNKKIGKILPTLLKKYQIIHLTGLNKQSVKIDSPYYHEYEFLNQEMVDAYGVADLVICRAGLSTIAELSALGKVSLIIPITDNQQENNAIFMQKHSAAAVLTEQQLAGHRTLKLIERLLVDDKIKRHYQKNIKKLYQEKGLENLVNIINETI
ncbi:glycosyltransferase [Patescibacteria group bacterium]